MEFGWKFHPVGGQCVRKQQIPIINYNSTTDLTLAFIVGSFSPIVSGWGVGGGRVSVGTGMGFKCSHTS